MGCFGYICPVCKQNIRCGERCILVHKREGKEIGRAQGHYDGYGRVEESEEFRGESGPNSHPEICTSEFGLSSSFNHGDMRVMPNGRLLNCAHIHSVVKAFVDVHSLEQISQDTTFSSVLNDELKKKCSEEAEFLFQIGDRKEVSEEEKQRIKAETESYLLLDKLKRKLEMDAACVQKILKWGANLPEWNGATSGIIAVHAYCAHKAKVPDVAQLPFSYPDPDQGCGRARKKFTQ